MRMTVAFGDSLPVVSDGISDRLFAAGIEMARQMVDELALYFGIAALVSMTDGRGCGCGPSITLETSANNTERRAAWNRAYGRFSAAIRDPLTLDQAVRSWDLARQRLSRQLNRTSARLTTSADGGRLISWWRTRTGSFYVNPFGFWLEDTSGRFVRALRGTPRAIATMGPTVQFLHEQDHEVGCIYQETDAGPCNENPGSPNLHHDSEAATARDTDQAIANHPDLVQERGYPGGDNGGVPGGRFNLAQGEYVIFPTAEQLRTGLLRPGPISEARPRMNHFQPRLTFYRTGTPRMS